MNRVDVKDFLKKVEKLPTLPAVAMRIVSVANNPRSAAEDLSRIINSDQSLSAKVLRMVNSAYYGMKNRIGSVKQAIVILGFNSIRSLALSTAVMDKFATSGKEVQGFSRVEFWKHSVAVAMTSRLIAKRMNLPEQLREDFFIAGLLHDLGKVILDQYFHEEFKQVVIEMVSLNQSFIHAELLVNGVTHAEIGSELAEQWNLPMPLVQAIRWHHDPYPRGEDQQIISVVHLANILAKTKGLGSGGDADISSLNEEAVKELNLPDEVVGNLLSSEMDAEWEKAKTFLQLLGKSS